MTAAAGAGLGAEEREALERVRGYVRVVPTLYDEDDPMPEGLTIDTSIDWDAAQQRGANGRLIRHDLTLADLEAMVAVVDRLAAADRDAGLRERVEAAVTCPHGWGRHYYAIDSTCQRCEMPSWVESALRAALDAEVGS